MKQLMTKAIRKKLVANYDNQDGAKEFKAVLKLFNPTDAGTLYLSEMNPDTHVAFGLCLITEKELGYVDLNELANFKGQMGLGIERDRLFTPKTLKECENL